MPVKVTHNNDGHFYTIDVDLAKEGAEVFDLTTYFKARVGDNGFGLRVRWFWQGQLYNTVGKKPHVEGVVGQYSFKKASNDVGRELVMSPDADPVSFTGDVNDCQADGYATYYFPQQMFPQDGMFKGTIGLLDDSGKTARYTSVDIWFKVYPNAGGAQMGKACDYYISELDKAIKEAEEDLKTSKKTMQDVVDEFTAKMNDLTNRLTTQGNTDQAALDALETKIKQDGLFTQAEAEAFKQTIEQEFNKLRNSAVTVFDTETDLMQANLNSGLTVRTLGCTAEADGLGAIYKIVNEQPASGYSIKLANGNYAMLVSIDAFRKAHMVYQAGQVGELSDQRSLKTTNLVTNHGVTVSRNTKGSGQDATVASIIANTQDPTSAVLGVDTPKIFTYKNLDSVALYVANGTDNPHITIQKGTYATTKNEFILNEDIEGIEPGMYIALTSVETTHSKLKVSDIAYLAQILTVSGRTLTVDGYYSKDSDEPLDAGPSPSTYTAYINPITKRWGINPVVEIGADDRPSGTAVEGDVKNHNASEAPDDLGVFDAVNLKEGKANYAFRAHTNSYSNPFDNGVDLTNTLNLLKGNGTPQSFTNIITTERTDKDIPYVMRYDGAVSYEALIPTTEQDANWASFQIQDAGASYTLKNIHDGQYLTLAIGTAGDFSLLVDEKNIQSIDYNDANTPRHGLKMTFQRANGGYMLFRIFVYQNRAYIVSMVNGKFISAEGS